MVAVLLAGCAATNREDPKIAEDELSEGEPSEGEPSEGEPSEDPPACGAQPIHFGACVRTSTSDSTGFRSASGVVQAIERSTVTCNGSELGRLYQAEEVHVLVLGGGDESSVVRVALKLPFSSLSFVRVGDTLSVERTGAAGWLDSPSYGTLTLRGAGGELLFWISDNSNGNGDVPELALSNGEATCTASNAECSAERLSLVVDTEEETVSIDPGDAADVGDFVVLHGENSDITSSHYECVGLTDTRVVAAVRGSQASLAARE